MLILTFSQNMLNNKPLSVHFRKQQVWDVATCTGPGQMLGIQHSPGSPSAEMDLGTLQDTECQAPVWHFSSQLCIVLNILCQNLESSL